jgi:hypothetical protein
MLAQVQSFVQQRYHTLLMGFIGLGFVMLFLELIGYQHYEGLQLIGLSATVIGAVVAFLGIRASGKRRRMLGAIFLALSLAGLLGAWFHNEDRLRGEQRTDGQFNQGQPPRPEEPGERAGPGPGGPGGQPGPGGPRIPPPPLAPLSLSGFCLLGAVALFGRRDPQ